MSRDCDYLFVWENQNYVLGEPAPLAKYALEKAAFNGALLLIDDTTLYASCHKHGLFIDQLKFPIPPDQIFERADGGWFHLITV